MEERKKFEVWLEEQKQKAKWIYQDAKKWCGDHKEQSVMIGIAVLSAGVELIKTTSRKSTVKEEKRLKERYIYDRSNGWYYETKRKLRTSEKLEIEERKDDGERLGHILRDMKVLKR